MDENSKGVVERDQQVMAVAQHIVKALRTSKNPTEDMIRFLSDIDLHLSKSKTPELEGKKLYISKMDERLDYVQDRVMSWDSDQSMIWDSNPEEASIYLQAVDEVRSLTEYLESLSLTEEDKVENELLCRADNILQMAMGRLEEEFSYVLAQNKQQLEPEHLSFRSTEDELVDQDSLSSIDDDSFENSRTRLQTDGSKGSEEYTIDLIHPNAIPELKCIAKVMFSSNYDQECSQAYISIRKDALDECLFILEVEITSIEEVLKMDWNNLDHKIKRWIRSMKIFVRVYLASEKRHCDQIFGEFGSVSQSCFTETSKGSILRLLNFGDAVAIGPRLPERLFQILNMYEGLADLLPDINSLFPEEAGSCVRTECDEVLTRLGDSIRGTIVEFENAVRKNTSINPFAGGAIHHVTKYVMNYIKALIEYSDTLNFLLENNCAMQQMSPSSSDNITREEEWRMSRSSTPMARHLGSITTTLESNLDAKSKLYKDISLQHFFLMNNIYYMVQKVKSSDLGALLGDDWIRTHNRKLQQHAMSYERASWSLILSFLRDEGIFSPGSSTPSKKVLKERFKSFNLAFEEIYKTQTAWLIPDPQLREDLRISLSLNVLQAYRMFKGRHASHLEGGRNSDKYIKYSEEDLQNYLLDFFEGSSKSLHNPRKR